MSTVAQTSANQANAQHSTGPATEEGKARSARNNFRHGLASGQLIVPVEDPADFEALAQDLFNEHQPATPTEENLVLSMAQHFWLGQRAIRLQTKPSRTAEASPNSHWSSVIKPPTSAPTAAASPTCSSSAAEGKLASNGKRRSRRLTARRNPITSAIRNTRTCS
jgi:hypothetical protein